MTVTRESAVFILTMLFASSGNRIEVELVRASDFSVRLSGFDLANDLKFELFGKLSALETHLRASFWILEA